MDLINAKRLCALLVLLAVVLAGCGIRGKKAPSISDLELGTEIGRHSVKEELREQYSDEWSEYDIDSALYDVLGGEGNNFVVVNYDSKGVVSKVTLSNNSNTRFSFMGILLGASEDEVEKALGKPDEIRTLADMSYQNDIFFYYYSDGRAECLFVEDELRGIVLEFDQ